MRNTNRSSEQLTATEAVIAAIWRELLNVPDVDPQDAFLDLGGDSVLATQVCWRIAEAFDVVVPVMFIFEYPTIHDLASLVDTQSVQRSGG